MVLSDEMKENFQILDFVVFFGESIVEIKMGMPRIASLLVYIYIYASEIAVENFFC